MPHRAERWISLGAACQVAHQLRRIGLSAETMFYDWIVTDHLTLLRTLDVNVGDDLFQKGYSLPKGGRHLFDAGTGLRFYPHDFLGLIEEDEVLVASQISKVREKYLGRLARMHNILASGEPICIVRHFFSEPAEQVAELQTEIVARLNQLYPGKERLFFWASDDNLEGSSFPHGTVYHLPRGATWHGDDASWDRAVSAFQAQG